MLVITHSNKVFRFYSFVWIVQHCTVINAKLGQVVETQEGRAGRVGEPGFGVPITIKMTGLLVYVLMCLYTCCTLFSPCIYIITYAVKPLYSGHFVKQPPPQITSNIMPYIYISIKQPPLYYSHKFMAHRLSL